MEHIEKFVDEIIAQKEKATNRDKMGELVDLVLEKIKNLAAGLYDPEAVSVLKAEHLKVLEAEKIKFDQLEAEYKEQLTQQDQEAEDLRTQLAEAMELVAAATEGFNANAVVSDSLETEVQGVRVKINFGVDYKGTYYSAEELVENTGILEHLLAIGSGSITLIEE
jgi:hypothetical protein